jgi:hypothetical protein
MLILPSNMDPMENDEIDFEYSESSARCEEMVSTY